MSWGAKFPKCRDARAGCPRPAGDRGSVGAEEARRGAASCFPARGEQVVGGAARRGERGRGRTKWRRGRDGEGGAPALGAPSAFSALWDAASSLRVPPGWAVQRQALARGSLREGRARGRCAKGGAGRGTHEEPRRTFWASAVRR